MENKNKNNNRIVPEVGMKVIIVDDCRRVKFPFKLTNRIGVIEKIDKLVMKNEDGTLTTLTENYPIIRVGKFRLGGMECWWYPLEKFMSEFKDILDILVKNDRIEIRKRVAES